MIKAVKLGWRYKGHRPIEAYAGEIIIDSDNEIGYEVIPKEVILEDMVDYLLKKIEHDKQT